MAFIGNGTFRILGNKDQWSDQTYAYHDNRGSCFERRVSAVNNSNAVTTTVCDQINADVNPYW